MSFKLEGVPAQHQEQAVELIKTVSNINATFDAGSAIAPLVTARANQAAGTEFEAALMTPMVQTYLGLDGLPLTAPVMDDMSLLRGSNPNHQRQIEHLKEIALADRGACIRNEAPAPLTFQVWLMRWNSNLGVLMQVMTFPFNLNALKKFAPISPRGHILRSFCTRWDTVLGCGINL